MANDENEIKISLQELDLTENEAKTIIGMVKIGTKCDAKNIYEVANVPRSKIYTTLKKLDELGLIMILPVEGGITHYESLPIDKILAILKKKKDQKIKLAIEKANANLKSVSSTINIESDEKLDYISIKGKERIIEQLKEIVSTSNQTSKITIFMPYLTYRDFSKAVLYTILEIAENKIKILDVTIIVNTEEYNEIEKDFDLSLIKDNFFVFDFTKFGIKGPIKPSKIPINEPGPNFIENLFNIFASRPFIMLVGTEAAFFVIEDASVTTALRIQNETFLQFQQNMLQSLLEIIKKGLNNFIS